MDKISFKNKEEQCYNWNFIDLISSKELHKWYVNMLI